MQLLLSIARPADPLANTWERLDPEAKKLLVELLTRILAQTVRPELFQSEASHDR